jgi:hypothetical protein
MRTVLSGRGDDAAFMVAGYRNPLLEVSAKSPEGRVINDI